MNIKHRVVESCKTIIKENPLVQTLLRFLLILSCWEEKFLVCSSNAAMLLNASETNFNDMNLTNLRLADTDITGGNFIRTDLKGSKMRRVNITSADFTESNLMNIDW